MHFSAHLTKASLYHRFSNYCLDSPDRDGRIICETSFRKILKESDQLAHIRWDNHGTGACATCKSLRYSLYNSRSDERVLESEQALSVHIRQALDLRQTMEEVIEIAQTEWNSDDLSFPVGLALACISFDFASGLKLPGIWEETQADWIAKTFGLDVHSFGITNEGARQYNAYFILRRWHTSILILSDLFFICSSRKILSLVTRESCMHTLTAVVDRIETSTLLPTG